MENEILNSLLKRPGLDAQVELLEDMIRDSMDEIRALLNYEKGGAAPRRSCSNRKRTDTDSLQQGRNGRDSERIPKFRWKHNLFR